MTLLLGWCQDMKRKYSNIEKKDTYHSRVKIGFSPHYDFWRTTKATFTEDKLIINGHCVVESWEAPYMYDLVEVVTRKGGVILEIGFGMGISSAYIQERDVSTHIIIEANQDVFVELIRFTHTAKVPIIPYLGFWQEITNKLESESFDGIIFDTYPLRQKEIHRTHFDFFPEAYRLLRPGGMFTYFSDEVQDFSDEHLVALKGAGFKHIDKRICQVTPSKDCIYWNDPTIITPIIQK